MRRCPPPEADADPRAGRALCGGKRPWAFHQTEEFSLYRILEQGLRAWDEEPDPDWQRGEWQGWCVPRAGRVYLWTGVKERGRPPALKVDLRQLDPERFGCDEDRIQPAWGLPAPERVGSDWRPANGPICLRRRSTRRHQHLLRQPGRVGHS